MDIDDRGASKCNDQKPALLIGRRTFYFPPLLQLPPLQADERLLGELAQPMKAVVIVNHNTQLENHLLVGIRSIEIAPALSSIRQDGAAV